MAVSAYEGGVGSYECVADLYGAGSASLKRWVRRKREYGTVEPSPHSGGTKLRVDERGLELLKGWVESQPDLSLDELRDKYNKRRRTDVSTATIGRAIRDRLGLRRKKRATDRSSKTRRECRF